MELTEQPLKGPSRQPAITPMMEYWLWSACIVVALTVILCSIIGIFEPLVFAIAGALVGIVVVVVGGTRVCLPLYLATAFGDAVPIPGAGGLSLNQCLALGVLAAFAIDLVRLPTNFKIRLPQVLLIILGIYILLMAVLLKPPETEYPTQPAYYMLIAVIITVFYWDLKRLNFLLGAIVILGMLVIVLPGYVEFITGKDFLLDGRVFEARRINGFAKDSVIFGSVCVWLLFFATYLAVSARMGLARILFGICIPMIMVVSLLTFNRQTPIVLVFCFSTMLYLLRSRVKYWMAGLIIIAGIAAAPFFLPTMFERFGTARRLLTDFSLIERHDKLEIAKEMLRTHPLFGVGHSVFKDTWFNYLPKGKIYLFLDNPRDRPAFVDMGYMQIVTEYGIVGATLTAMFFVTVGFLFKRTYHLSRKLDDPLYTNLLAMCAALFVQLLISLFVRDAFLTPQTFVVLGVFFATCTATEQAVTRALAEAQPPTLESLPA